MTQAIRVRRGCGCACPQYGGCPMHVSLTERALRLAVANGHPFCAHCVRQLQLLRARLLTGGLVYHESSNEWWVHT